MREKIVVLTQRIQSLVYSDSFKLSIVFTLFWGVVAHAYGFLQGTVTHDSLDAINAAEGDNRWKIMLGRVLAPLYHTVARGDVVLPWVIGVLSIAYISLAVFLTIKIFKIKSKVLMFLVAGIFVANNTVTATAATYMHDFDQNMFGLLCAVLAVCLWHYSKKGFLIATIPVGISIALYQAYISTTITLALMVLILELLNGRSVQLVFVKGLKAVGMLVGGCIVYFLIMKIVLMITGLELKSGNYNSVDTVFSMSIGRFVFCVAKGYFNSIRQFIDAASSYYRLFNIGLHSLLLVMGGICVFVQLFFKKLTIGTKCLVLLLIGLLPIGVNVVYLLTNGMSHDLMHFALWLVYLFILLVLLQYSSKGNVLWYVLSIVVVVIVLWGNVRLANLAYLKKEYISRAGDSYFTRLLERIESVDGYEPGVSSVVFAGEPSLIPEDIDAFQRANRLTGVGYQFIIGGPGRSYYKSYFSTILEVEILLAERDVWNSLQNDYRVAEMPVYPNRGCVKTIDNILVIKQGQTKLEEFCPMVKQVESYCQESYKLPHVDGWYADPQADFLVYPVANLVALNLSPGQEVSVKVIYKDLPPALSLYQRCKNSILSISSAVTEMRKALPLLGYAIQTPKGAYVVVKHNHQIPRESIVSLRIEAK